MAQFLCTSWQVNTEQAHDIEITHRDLPVANMGDAARQQHLVGEVRLMPDGRLLHYRRRNGSDPQEIDKEDVLIRVYTRPMDQRGQPFIPDTSTEQGRAIILATFSNPAYRARLGEFEVMNISLADLAALPGASGWLGIRAYGISTR